MAVTSLCSQVHHMNTVFGSCVTAHISLIAPWREPLVHFHGAGGDGRPVCLCVLLLHVTATQAHSVVLFVRTSAEISHIWPLDPELLGDMSLCGLRNKILSCLETCWFFHGRTCQKRHSICSQGLSSIATPGGRSRGETGSLSSQQTPPATWEENSPLSHHLCFSEPAGHGLPSTQSMPSK